MMVNRGKPFCQRLASGRQNRAGPLVLTALAFAMVLLGIGWTAGSAAFLPLSPSAPQAKALVAPEKSGRPALGEVRQVPGAAAARRSDVLTSPFAERHVSRQTLQQPVAEPPALPAVTSEDRQAAAPAAKQPLCLTGIVRSRRGALAILSRDGQQWLLAEGETAGGITLLSLHDAAVRVRDAAGERELALEK